MIGKVVEELGVDYKWPVMKENEDGTQTELTKPYTKYSVEVIENLKRRAFSGQTNSYNKRWWDNKGRKIL